MTTMEMWSVTMLISPACIGMAWVLIQRWMTRQESMFLRLESKLDALTVQHADCTRQFADKEENRDSHARIYKRIESLERSVGELSGQGAVIKH